MSEYKPTEYVVDFGDYRSSRFVGLSMALIEQNGAKLHERIVRCRDCKYMHRVRNWLGMDVDECWLHADRESGALGKERTEPDGFCAWGVRKEDA